MKCSSFLILKKRLSFCAKRSTAASIYCQHTLTLRRGLSLRLPSTGSCLSLLPGFTSGCARATPSQHRRGLLPWQCTPGWLHRWSSPVLVDVGVALQQHLHHIDVASLRESRNEMLWTVRTVRFAAPPSQQPQDYLQARPANATAPALIRDAEGSIGIDAYIRKRPRDGPRNAPVSHHKVGVWGRRFVHLPRDAHTSNRLHPTFTSSPAANCRLQSLALSVFRRGQQIGV